MLRQISFFLLMTFMMHPWGVVHANDYRTLESALRHTLQNNPDILAAQAQLDAVHERIGLAYAGWRPTVTTQLSVTALEFENELVAGGVNDGDNVSKDVNVSVSQPLFTGFTASSDIKAANALYKSQKYILDSVVQDVLARAVEAYMDVMLKGFEIALNENNLFLLSEQLEATRTRYDVGELTRTDLAQAEARYNGAHADLIAAQGAYGVANAVFTEVVGSKPDDLEEPLSLPSYLPSSLDEAIEKARNINPLLFSAKFIEEAARYEIDAEFGDLLPKLSLQGSYDKSYDPASGALKESDQASLAIVASLSLYEGGGKRSQIREARYTASQRSIEVHQRERAIIQNVVEAWQNFKTAGSVILARESQVAAAEIAREGAHEENLVGERSVIDSLDSDQDLLDAQTKLAEARRNEIVAAYRLLAAIGTLKP